MKTINSKQTQNRVDFWIFNCSAMFEKPQNGPQLDKSQMFSKTIFDLFDAVFFRKFENFEH